jgi:hypothetical protein
MAKNIRRWGRKKPAKASIPESLTTQNQEPYRWGCPETWPSRASQMAQNWDTSNVLSHLNMSAQVHEGAAQGKLRAAYSWAHFKTASVQAWKRNWHLMRPFFADDYCANKLEY